MTATDPNPRFKPASKKPRSDPDKSVYDAKTIDFLFYSTAIIVTCIKFLLIPAYYSTDLEVHRNWMAITYNKPLVEWYTENTSQWTLDYPPFFAYFEYILAYFARFFDQKMLQIQRGAYMSPQTLFYLRLTVIISDLVYYYGVYVWICLMYQRKQKIFAAIPTMKAKSNFFLSSTSFIHITLFLFNIGHLIVDHIHFQYNGFLNGLLLLSMARICNQQIYWGAFWFAVLLNLKHIYLYMAPAYFFYLFMEYCLVYNRGSVKIRFNVLLRLAVIVAGVFALSFFPFVINGQIGNVLKRLFPFQRGLSHAYWAPNIWALYNGFDLLMARYYNATNRSPFTRGLVQQYEHMVLPNITPTMTLAIVLVVLTCIFTIYVWNYFYASETSRNSNHSKITTEIRFINLVLLSSLTFYEFGYHVHEKSILLIVPTLIPLIFVKIDYARIFLLLSNSGYYSLFPLLYKEAEALVKILLMAIHLAFSFGTFNSRYRIVGRWQNPDVNVGGDDGELEQEKLNISPIQKSSTLRLPLLNWLESLYIYGFIFVHFLYSFAPCILPTIFERYQFILLMTVSLYCSFGIFYCYLGLIQISSKKF